MSDILVISPTPTHPLVSGNRKRIFEMLTALRETGCRIHFRLFNVFNSPGLDNQASLDVMATQWESFAFVRADLRSQSYAVRARRRVLKSQLYRELAWRGLRLPLQYHLDDLCCDNFVQYAAAEFKKRDYDSVLVEYVYLSRVLDAAPTHVVKVLDTHDVFANRHSRLLHGGVRPGFFTTTPAAEARGLNRADVAIAIQDEERRYFAGQVNSTTEVITVAHLEPDRTLQRPSSTVKTIGLIGSNNDINLESIRRFTSAFAARPELAKIKILIGGAVCQRLGGLPENVELLGVVDSLQTFFEQIDLFINPMIAGTGLKIKTVESLSYGVPLLSTVTGSEGIEETQMYHRFATISDLLDHLSKMVTGSKPLAPYAEASRHCFKHYTAQVQSQIQSLANRFSDRKIASTIPC